MSKERLLICLHQLNETRKSLEADMERIEKEFHDFLVEEKKAGRYYGFYGRWFCSDHFDMLSTEEMEILPDRMRYVWGGPGPDFDDFLFVDYGKTWYFTEDKGNDK